MAIDQDRTFRSGKDDPAYHKLINPAPELDAEKLLAGLTEIKVTSLKEAIDDIKGMVSERRELSGVIFNDIERMKTELSNLVFQLNPETHKLEILNLKKKMFEFDELRVQEKLNNFRDIALLKRELREREQEFRERETRSSVLDELLQS